MEFHIKKKVKIYGESEFANKYQLNLPTGFSETRPAKSSQLWIFTKNKSSSLFLSDPSELALQLFEELGSFLSRRYRGRQLASIESSTTFLKNALEKLREDDKLEIEGIAKKIDTALQEIKRIDEHDKKLLSFEKDITGMRHIVGESKEFQEWRVLTSDVQRLKEEHVARKEFDADIRRLDQRIDSLNTRIEDFKEIRFWSKRTILDIALAIIAAASSTFAALLAAGIITL